MSSLRRAVPAAAGALAVFTAIAAFGFLLGALWAEQ